MKIICAGYPKTGTKSCSAALRMLGFQVADYLGTLKFQNFHCNSDFVTVLLETVEYLSGTWLDYLNGEATIEDVLEEYKKYGFDQGFAD